tara:strand:- start:76 stop:444 length:369 start_codon:yes stop_codon:yes gene_type:complete
MPKVEESKKEKQLDASPKNEQGPAEKIVANENLEPAQKELTKKEIQEIQEKNVRERQALVVTVTSCARTLGFNIDESGINVLIATVDLVRQKGQAVTIQELETLRNILVQDQKRAQSIRDAK